MTKPKDEIETLIVKSMKDVAKSVDATLVDDLSETTPLLKSGLDSLGFAMLVAQLEEELGYDPFVSSETATYPTTLRELVDFYAANQS